MSNIVSLSEYHLDPFAIARDVLLGAVLCSRIGGRLCRGKIVELELYMGDIDRACHAYPHKKTARNAVMFGRGGHAYIYFVYGMHNMFNVVISAPDCPNAILIRALEPIDGIDVMRGRRGMSDLRNLANGPGKLAAAMGIDRAMNGADLTTGATVWIERRDRAPEIAAGPRIGVDYAGDDAALPWRFLIKGNPFVSRTIARS
jgi:DNA-3-methyladenine glycosylase